MIEKIVLEHLSAVLTVPVWMEIPPDAPAEFVIIEKTGSDTTNRIQSATMAIQSYGATLYAAATLNETVKTAMEALNANDLIGRCVLNTDYNYTDLATKRHRYQSVYDITHY